METCNQSQGFQPGEVGSWVLQEGGHILPSLTTRCWRYQVSQVSFDEQADQDSWGPASTKVSQHPKVKPPQPSGLQEQDFQDVMATRSSDWFQQPSGVGGSPAPQLDTGSSCDSEPLFWQDVLTQQLWQIFAGTHDKADPSRHRRESPRGWEAGGLGTRGGQHRLNLVFLLSLPTPSSPPTATVPEQMPGMVSEWAGGEPGWAPVGVFRFLWGWPASSTLSPSVPSKESGLCPEALSSAWIRGLGQLPSPILTACASLRFSGSKTNLGQVLWSDPVSCWQESQNVGPFYFGAEPYIEDALGNSSGMGGGKGGGRQLIPGGPYLLLNCQFSTHLCPSTSPLQVSKKGA